MYNSAKDFESNKLSIAHAANKNKRLHPLLYAQETLPWTLVYSDEIDERT